MTRAWFGRGAEDFIVAGPLVAGDTYRSPGQTVLTFWDAETGGTQHVDLLLNGDPVTSITVPASGITPAFQGPDGVVAMWAQAGNSTTRRMVDAGADIAVQVAADRDAVAADRAVVEGIGTTNDTLIAGRVADTTSATAGELAAAAGDNTHPLGAQLLASTANSIAPGETDPQAAVDARVVSVGTATFAPANLPTAAIAAGAEHFYDAARALYNFKPSNTRKLHAGIARARAGTGVAKWASLGDSTEAGFGATLNTGAPLIRARDILEAAGVPVLGTGPVVANPAGAPGGFIDPRYTRTGTDWTTQAGNPNGILQTSVVDSNLTFTSDRTGTVVEICYLSLGTPWQYRIDGGIWVSMSPASTGALGRELVTTVPGSGTPLADITHTVDIRIHAAGTFHVAWVDVRKSSGGGILMANFGVSNTTTDNWLNPQFYFPGNVAVNWAPEVGYLGLGINDKAAGVSAADWKTKRQNAINMFTTGGCELILLTQNPTQAADYADYNQVNYELADANDLPLLDVHEVFQSWAQANTEGLMFDSAHPSAAGYAVKGALMAGALLA